jgi:hypothetical protein
MTILDDVLAVIESFYPMSPPKVLLSGALAKATHPRQSQRNVPPALDPVLHGIVWCNSNFHSLLPQALLHRCTARRVAPSVPAFDGNSMHVL